MIVVAIIGILASIALPAYQTYVAKSMVTSNFATAAAGRIPIFQFYTDKGRMPTPSDMETDSDLKGFDNIMQNHLPGGGTAARYHSSETVFLYIITLDGINGNVNGKGLWL